MTGCGSVLGSGSAAQSDLGGAGLMLLGMMSSVAALAEPPPWLDNGSQEQHSILGTALRSSVTIGWWGVSSGDLCQGRDASGPSKVGSQDSEVGVRRNGGTASEILGGTEGGPVKERRVRQGHKMTEVITWVQ